MEQTLNGLLDAEADRLCAAGRYERTEARKDTRAGHYTRKLEFWGQEFWGHLTEFWGHLT